VSRNPNPDVSGQQKCQPLAHLENTGEEERSPLKEAHAQYVDCHKGW